MKPPIGAQVSTGHPLAYGLVGAWLFNEGAGLTVLDRSNTSAVSNGVDSNVSKANGTLTRMTSAAWQGPGLSVDGVDDVISLGAVAKLKPTKAVSLVVRAWCQNLAAQSQQMYRAAGHAAGSWGFVMAGGIDRNGNLAASSIFSGVTSGAADYFIAGTIPDKGPHTWVLTWDTTAALVRLYRDGAEVDRRATSAGMSLAYTNQESVIGDGRLASAWFPFRGIFEHVFLYDRALAGGEVAQLSIDPYAMFRTRRDVAASVGAANSPFFYRRFVASRGASR